MSQWKECTLYGVDAVAVAGAAAGSGTEIPGIAAVGLSADKLKRAPQELMKLPRGMFQ